MWLACGGDEAASRDSGPGLPDAGADGADAGDGKCVRNADCSDGDWCNGDERCAPDDPDADARGCVAATTVPCGAGGTCEDDPPSCTRSCDLVPPPPPDPTCTFDIDCQDESFCDGHEACMPGAEGSDERGCHAAWVLPCFIEQSCDETHQCQEWDWQCASDDDFDRDGHRSTTCGGDDCDDADSHTYPGNPEWCEGTLPDGRAASDHDEDCNWATNALVGFDGDQDGDGYVSDQCCNRHLLDGTWRCSGDCDDENPNVHPAQPEVCNGIDDNCDGQIDEGLATIQFRDADGDGFGDALCSALACPSTAGLVANRGDCDDARPGAITGSTACGGAADEVLVCDAGTWTAASCGGRQRCESQPNGTGLCQ